MLSIPTIYDIYYNITVFFFWFSFFVNGISLFLKTISYLELVPTLMIDDAETKMRTEASLLFELKTSVPFCQALQLVS
jgi:hypothetical protein